MKGFKIGQLEITPPAAVPTPRVAPPKAPEVKTKALHPIELSSPKATFMHLTKQTCPFGHEGKYYGKMLKKLGFKSCHIGNYWKVVGDNPTTMFCAHMDTASYGVHQIVRHNVKGVIYTDKTTLLGADDRAGMTVLLHLQDKGVPGVYVLFVGEESGCQGSSEALLAYPEFFEGITKAVAFDRRGFDSVITHQMGSECCSPSFAEALVSELKSFGLNKFAKDSGGSYTDTNEFTGVISECTNLSVGYQNAHSVTETQDLQFLTDLTEAASMIDWESLPVARVPVKVEPWADWNNRSYSEDVVWSKEGDQVWVADADGIYQCISREELRQRIAKINSPTLNADMWESEVSSLLMMEGVDYLDFQPKAWGDMYMAGLSATEAVSSMMMNPVWDDEYYFGKGEAELPLWWSDEDEKDNPFKA